MQEIISRARAGDAAALEVLLREIRPELRRWADQALSQRYAARFDASDVTQETLLDVWQRIEQFLGDSPEEFGSWLKQTLTRDVHDAIRHAAARKRSVECEQSPVVHGGKDPIEELWAKNDSTPSQYAMRNEEAERLQRALAAIPGDQAKAIELVHFRGLSLDQAANEMGRSKAALVQLMKRAIASLRKNFPKSVSELRNDSRLG